MSLMYSPRGGGNATVPNDAPIQPPQAFVSWAAVTLLADFTAVDYSNLGITHFVADSTLFYNGGAGDRLKLAFDLGSTTGNFSGNALPAADINAILAQAVAAFNDFTVIGTLNLSGGTNAAPTGQGITDKNTLIANGWTVTTN